MNYNRNADKTIDFFRESSRAILGLVDSVDLTFIGTVTRLAPIVAPAPAAYSVYRAMVAIETPQWVAILTAVTVELIGMFQSKTALRARNWNLIKLKSDPAAPFELALLMAFIYFLVALGLTTIIEFAPTWSKVIYPAFVVFAASVYVSNAIASDLTRWEVDRSDRLREQGQRTGLKADIRRLTDQHDRLTQKIKKLTDEAHRLGNEVTALTGQRDGLRAEITGHHNGQNTFGPQNLADGRAKVNRAKQLDRADRRGKLSDLLTGQPDLTNPELADLLGVSVSTIKKDKRSLNGHSNGHGGGQ